MSIRVGVHVLWTPDSVIGACVLRTLAIANMADTFFSLPTSRITERPEGGRRIVTTLGSPPSVGVTAI